MSELIKELLLRSAMEIDLELDTDKLVKFLLFADELKKWNKKINLTTITNDRDIALKHFADSLLLSELVGDSVNLLDIGSGGGFPSIPIKIVMPQLSVVSVDAVEKKIIFQRHIARLLCFDEFTAVHARCEDLLSSYGANFELIVSRAFSDIVSFAGLAVPFLGKKGRLIAMKGRGGSAEVSGAMSRLLQMGIIVTEVKYKRLPISGEPRCFIVMEKNNG
jgi:16S rRNA (guanine527-N7)-methyltransferase